MAGKNKRAPKRSNTRDSSTNTNNDNEDGSPPARRPRPVNGSGDAKPSSSSNGSVTLASQRVYKFDCDAVGSFHMRSGNTGNFTVSGCKVTIKDDQGTTVFHLGGPNDKIEIKDVAANDTTTVTLIPGAYIPTNTRKNNQRYMNNVNGISIQSSNGTTTVTTGNGNVFISQSGGSYGHVDQTSAINVVAGYNESILLWGGLDFEINGDGGFVKMTGGGDLVVNGSPQSINQTGSATIEVDGDVNGPIQQTGAGSLSVGGKVTGSISQTGTGEISVDYEVIGSVSQTGTGEIEIKGYVQSKVSQIGTGRIVIHDDVWSNISQIGVGNITVYGVQQRGRVSKLGFGYLTVNGTRY